MQKPRLELHELFIDILGSGNVYFQPPENEKMKYPCIIYRLANIDDRKADNIKYLKHNRYEVTLIHRDPENTVYGELNDLPYCDFDRSYVADNLYHYVFTLFF